MIAPVVTVVTPVRNGQRYLPEAIASIRSQTFTDWEYVIVDDASTDDTVGIVEAVQREDSRIRLIRREAGGDVYAACNDGISHARGRLIVYLDSDDVAASDRIERQLAYLAARPELRGCAGKSRFLRRSTQLQRWLARWPAVPTPRALRWHLCVRRNLLHSSACVERAAFDEIGGYREGVLHQDLRMWCDLARRQWLGFTPSVVVHKRLHRDQLTKRATQQSLVEPVLDVLDEHVTAVAGGDWSRKEVIALYDLQRRSGSPGALSLRVLDRWQDAWRSDETLNSDDRNYLTRLARVMRTRLLLLRVSAVTGVRRKRADVF